MQPQKKAEAEGDNDSHRHQSNDDSQSAHCFYFSTNRRSTKPGGLSRERIRSQIRYAAGNLVMELLLRILNFLHVILSLPERRHTSEFANHSFTGVIGGAMAFS